MATYFRNFSTSPPKGFSQQYILMTLIPVMISLITRILRSVHSAVFTLVQKNVCEFVSHYSDVRMGAIASQITSLTIVYSIVYSDANQRKHQSSASLAFVWGIHRGPVNSPHKWPVTRKMFPFDDVIMVRSRYAEHSKTGDKENAFWGWIEDFKLGWGGVGVGGGVQCSWVAVEVVRECCVWYSWLLAFPLVSIYSWWRHQMETFSALLGICAGNFHRSPVNSPHKGQWRGDLMFSLICVWINGWRNNREAGDLRRHPTHCDLIVMSALKRSQWRHYFSEYKSCTCSILVRITRSRLLSSHVTVRYGMSLRNGLVCYLCRGSLIQSGAVITQSILKSIHKRHPIARPLGRGMGRLLWIQHRIDILFCLSSCNQLCNNLLYWAAL